MVAAGNHLTAFSANHGVHIEAQTNLAEKDGSESGHQSRWLWK